MTRRKDGLQCTATAKTTGNRCGNPPIPGGTVCKYHGGAAPQTRALAAMRVFEGMVGLGLVRYRHLIEDENTPAHVLATILRDLFDRTGYGAPKTIDIRLTDAMLERELALRLEEMGEE